VTRALTVWRPDPASPSGVSPDETRPRLSAQDAARIADYLDAGALVARTTARKPDPWSGSDAAQVPLTQRTDGVWRWDDAVSYYVRVYGLSPGAEFVAHVRGRGFTPPVLTGTQVSAVIDEVFGAMGEVPAREILLDGSQLLPSDSYCVYQGRSFRYSFYGRSAELRIRLAVSPGQVIPDGFEPKADRNAFVQAIAYKTISAFDVEAFYRVVTTCDYKDAPFRIERLDGTGLRLSIGGGRDDKRNVRQPTLDEWAQFPNVEVLGVGEVWADVDVLEAARVTMAVIPYHLVSGRLTPVRDVTGYGYSVPNADQIFYFPSPADSPYLPPDDATAAVRAHDPQYPLDGVTPERLRDGWRFNPLVPVPEIYQVSDDGVIFTAAAEAPVEQVSSRLSADFRSRHPCVEPPPAHDSGNEVFA
jgi:hypothetical protein